MRESDTGDDESGLGDHVAFPSCEPRPYADRAAARNINQRDFCCRHPDIQAAGHPDIQAAKFARTKNNVLPFFSCYSKKAAFPEDAARQSLSTNGFARTSQIDAKGPGCPFTASEFLDAPEYVGAASNAVKTNSTYSGIAARALARLLLLATLATDSRGRRPNLFGSRSPDRRADEHALRHTARPRRAECVDRRGV